MALTDTSHLDLPNEFLGTLTPGDVLIHHCQTIHRSGPNASDRPRCGLLLVYRGVHTQTDPELKARYDHALGLSLSSS